MDLLHSPSRLLSIAAAIQLNVFPAPTAWAARQFPPYRIRAITFFWWGRSLMAGFMRKTQVASVVFSGTDAVETLHYTVLPDVPFAVDP